MIDSTVSPWTAGAQARWQHIAAHRFEDADAPLDFCAKLAREQGWTRDEARAAIEEYRRFCFLATQTAQAVVPSVEVDAVWHLHLTYTRDYWEQFCPQVLGFAFHHEPGGLRRGDLMRYRERYAETLASYEQFFGAPPERWWPGTATRFASPRRHVQFDPHRHWLLRKPRMATLAAPAAALVALLVLVGPATALPMNPLDWQGPRFLMLFLLLMLTSIVVGVIVRRRRSDSDRAHSAQGLDPSAIALLAGGEQRVIDLVVGELLARQLAVFDADSARLQVHDVPIDLDPAANDIASALQRDGNLANVSARVGPSLKLLRAKLEQRGLLLGADAAAAVARASATAPALVLAFGLMKIVVGVSRDRPVGLLVALCVILAVITLLMYFVRPTQSRSGARVLAELRQRHARAMRAPRGNEWPIALALVGTTVLSGTAFAAFHDFRQPPSSTSSSDSSSTSSDSSSSDSGGDSGGSGCGGCGGGGGD